MILTFIGRLIQFAIMLISFKLMTSILNPVEMGRVAIATAGISFFTLFLINPVGMFINRQIIVWFNSGQARNYFHLFTLYLVVVGLMAVLAWLLATELGLNLAQLESRWILILVGCGLFFSTILHTLVPSLNLLGRELSFTVLTVFTLILNLLLSLVFSYSFEAKAEYWMAGSLISQIIFSCIAYFVFFFQYPANKPRIRPSSTQLIQTFHYCWPVAITVGLNWFHMQGYRFLLADEFGLAELGLFAVGYSIAAAFISAIETILITWFQPVFYRAIHSNNQAEHDTAWSVYAGRMLPASLLGLSALVAASQKLPGLILGSAYQHVGHIIILAAFAEWSRMLVGVFSLNSHRQMATQQLIIPHALGAFFSFVGSMTCLQVLGLGNVSVPICIAFGSGVIVTMLWKAGKQSDIHFHLNLRRLGIQGLGLLLAALLIMRLLNSLPFQGIYATVLSFVIIGITWLVFWFFMRKDFKGIFFA